ncbi:MAG: glycosyltransferase family 9 protein [Ignavibacteriota bacterium]
MTLKQKIVQNSYFNKVLIFFLFLFFRLIRIIFKDKQKNNETLAIISLNKLGDTVFTIPAIVQLLKFYKGKTFYIICFGDSKIIYNQIIKNVKYCILNKNDFYFNGRLASLTAIKQLKSISPNTIVDLTGAINSASLILTSRCQTIYGVNESLYKGIYDEYKVIRDRPHQIDIYFDALGSLIPERLKKFSGYKNKNNNLGVILIQPLAGWKAKEWGINNFLKLYEKISYHNKCAFIFPKNGLDQDVVSTLDQSGIKIILAENIEDLISNISKCRIFVSNDSGPLQIAALLGKPTFSIYGPTNPTFHLPFGGNHISIQKQLKCTPKTTKYCYTFGGKYCPHFDCMTLLNVNEVFESLENLIAKLTDVNRDISFLGEL